MLLTGSNENSMLNLVNNLVYSLKKDIQGNGGQIDSGSCSTTIGTGACGSCSNGRGSSPVVEMAVTHWLLTKIIIKFVSLVVWPKIHV